MHNSTRALCLAACFIGSTCTAQTLNILTWQAEFADETIRQWEERSGVRVNQIYFDQEEVRNSILLSSEVSDIDIVTVDPGTAAYAGARDIFVPIEQYQNTAYFQHFDPEWAQGCAPYATPYLWGTLGIVYRKDRVSIPPTSWQDLLEPSEEVIGHIGWVENYIDTLAPALILHNHSVATDDENLLKEVFEKMKDLLPTIFTFEYAISYLGENPKSDELYMALAYSGDQQELNYLSSSQQWEYVVPEEGSMVWSECLAVLKHSEKQALAMDFISFINTPEIAAANSEAISIASSNAAATALQGEALSNNPSFTLDAEQRGKLIRYDAEFSVRNILLRDRITSTLVELHESQ